MSIVNKLKRFFKKISGCELIKKTTWYNNMFVSVNHDVYPDNVWYRQNDERNFDVVALGSSSAKYAYDFSSSCVKGMNWAQEPQTLLEDFNLLRNFHSILKKKGYVLITIMPFTGLNKKTGMMDALKYLKIDAHEPIERCMLEDAKRYEEYPILFGKPAIKAGIKYILKRKDKKNIDITQLSNNTKDTVALKQDAEMWINGWKRQFSIDDFDHSLTAENKKGRDFRITLMRKIIDFCIERSYIPVYVIPPVTSHLNSYFTTMFKKTYIYDFLNEINRDVKLLDFSQDDELQNDELYFNSFYLNKKGRDLFTKKVIKSLNLSK